jgi:nitrogen fixation protein FixH
VENQPIPHANAKHLLPTEAMNDTPTRSFNFWPWLPAFVIGAAVIANVAIIIAAKRVSPQKVEEQAYAASVHFDADKAAAEAFIARGHQLDTSAPDSSTLRLVINGTPAQGAGELRLYRPDAPGADRTVAWSDVTQPLVIPLTRQGVWRLDLRLVAPDGTNLAAKTVIDTTGGRSP